MVHQPVHQLCTPVSLSRTRENSLAKKTFVTFYTVQPLRNCATFRGDVKANRFKIPRKPGRGKAEEKTRIRIRLINSVLSFARSRDNNRNSRLIPRSVGNIVRASRYPWLAETTKNKKAEDKSSVLILELFPSFYLLINERAKICISGSFNGFL